MMLAELDIDLLQAEMACWGPDDDESDDDTAEVDINDPRRLTGLDAVRCPCPPLEPYPPAGWLSLRAWEELTALAALDAACEVDGTAVWVPMGKVREAWLSLTQSATVFETALVPGLRFDFDIGHN